MDNKLKELEHKLAVKYKDLTEQVSDNIIYLKDFIMYDGTILTRDEFDEEDTDGESIANGFYSDGNQIYVTTASAGGYDCPLKKYSPFRPEFKSIFLNYISDENNFDMEDEDIDLKEYNKQHGDIQIEDAFKGFIGEDNEVIQDYMEEHGMCKTMIEFQDALTEKTKLVIKEFQPGDKIIVPLEALYDEGDDKPTMSPIDVALLKSEDGSVLNTEKKFFSYVAYKEAAIDTVWHKDEFRIKEFNTIDSFIKWTKSEIAFDHMNKILKL